MKAGEIDWDAIFAQTRWFHTGGIFCALSETTPEVAMEAMQSARRHGAMVSYDLNYRASLWQSIGGRKRAQEVNRRIAPLVDVMIGNEEDFSAALGFEVDHRMLDIGQFKKMIETVVKEFPFPVVATTLRKATTATRNDWGAICYCEGAFYEAQVRKDLEIYDRVGGGDSFASGLIYGTLTGRGPQWAVECGAAHGALAMTTPGDTSYGDRRRSVSLDDRRIGPNRAMKKHEVRKKLLDVGIIPVVRAATAAAAIEISHAICAGGIPIIELTMTVPGGVDAIAELSRSLPDVLIGAGTVLDAFTAQRCMKAGAQFIVSPGLIGEVLKFAHDQKRSDHPRSADADRSDQRLEVRLRSGEDFPLLQRGRPESHQSAEGSATAHLHDPDRRRKSVECRSLSARRRLGHRSGRRADRGRVGYGNRAPVRCRRRSIASLLSRVV